MAHTPATLPIVDLSRFHEDRAPDLAFLAELRHAAHDIGFFYLAGVSASRTDLTLEVASRFFALPEADKLAINMVNSPQFRGYTQPGRELTRGIPDWREQLDVGVE